MSGRTTKFRLPAKAAVGALMASILVIPLAATGAEATPWHTSPGIEGGMVFGPDGAFYSFNDDYQVVRRDAAGDVTVVAGRGFLDGNEGPRVDGGHGLLRRRRSGRRRAALVPRCPGVRRTGQPVHLRPRERRDP
jgi:hypothetical protein